MIDNETGIEESMLSDDDYVDPFIIGDNQLLKKEIVDIEDREEV